MPAKRLVKISDSVVKNLFFLPVFMWLTFSASAQNAPANDPLAQAKLDIWTETASFVYRDANIPEPATLANATDLNQFVEAIKKEDSKSQIFSKLYRPIEETGTYKKGTDEKAQLDLLIKSINLKLRENEARMKDINRRQKLSDLYKQLQQIAADYTTPTPSPTAVAATGKVDTADLGDFTEPVNTAVSNPTVPDTSAENYAENQLSSIAKKQNNSFTDNYKWMSTAALVLGILNLFLFYFLFKGINKLNVRMDQRKKDLDALTQQLNAGGRSGNSSVDGKLTMSAIESMVQKTIARELAKNGPSGPNRPIQPAAKYEPKPEPILVREEPVVSPSPVSEEPAALSGTGAPINEEAQVLPVTPVASAPTPEQKPQSFFARVPVNGGFHEQDLYPTQQHDSIYEIRLSKKDPTKAAFRIVTNTNVHRTAIESAYLSLKDACNYQLNNQNATRIVTDEPGLLSLQDGTWRIDKKAQVHFE